MFLYEQSVRNLDGGLMMADTWSPAEELNQETVGINSWKNRDVIAYRIKEMRRAADSIERALPDIERISGIIAQRLANAASRVITIGAGGSGVAAMMVMRELPQNHRDLDPVRFTYRVAGGARFLEPLGCEELEDSADEGARDAAALSLTAVDTLIAVSATGRTPYTCGAAHAARLSGAFVVGLICRRNSELEAKVDTPIVLETGPEMFFGATCEKAATAQKVALTAVMDVVVVRLGVTDGNVCRAREIHEKARLRKRYFEEMAKRGT